MNMESLQCIQIFVNNFKNTVLQFYLRLLIYRFFYNTLILFVVKYDDANDQYFRHCTDDYEYIFGQSLVKWVFQLNFQTLFMISYSLDYYNSYNLIKNEKEHTCFRCIKKNYCLIHLQQENLNINLYNFKNYIGYLSYQPLYLCGPIITFNSFTQQVYNNQQFYGKKEIFIYLIKNFFYFYMLELMLHLVYPYALLNKSQNIHLWQNYSFFWFLGLCHIMLFFLYLKFMVIWRFMRIWALIDGIESWENMQNCIMGTYTFQQFWRNWHGSFNKWLIRYLYVPLGGQKHRIRNVFIVFSFVALWHDFNLQLLLWALFICSVIIVEQIIQNFFKNISTKYKYLRALAAGLDLHLQMIANLIGFSFGVMGLQTINFFSLEAILSQCLFVFLLAFMIVLTFVKQSENFDKIQNK